MEYTAILAGLGGSLVCYIILDNQIQKHGDDTARTQIAHLTSGYKLPFWGLVYLWSLPCVILVRLLYGKRTNRRIKEGMPGKAEVHPSGGQESVKADNGPYSLGVIVQSRAHERLPRKEGPHLAGGIQGGLYLPGDDP